MTKKSPLPKCIVFALVSLACAPGSMALAMRQAPPDNPASSPIQSADQAAAAALASANSSSVEKVVYWQVGVTVVPKTWPVRGGVVRIPIPGEWPEQRVMMVSEDPGTGMAYVQKKIDGGLDILEVEIPRIAKGDKAELSIIYQVTLRVIPFPDQPQYLVKPAKPDRSLIPYLNSSPLIDPKHHTIKKLVEAETKDLANDWVRVEKLYDWVLQNITLSADKPVGAVKTLANRKGSREDRVNLFVALCRCFKVPARTVWANGVEYAEFYLSDPQGGGQWIPCHFSGAREFGSLTHLAVIEQKGESFELPGSDEKKRFVNATASVQTERNVRGDPERPSIVFQRRAVPRPPDSSDTTGKR